MIIGQRPSTGARRLCTRLECQGRQRTDVRTCTGTDGQTEATRTHCNGLLHWLTLVPSLSPSSSTIAPPFSPSSASLFSYTSGHCHSPACLVSHFPSNGLTLPLSFSFLRPASLFSCAGLTPLLLLAFLSFSSLVRFSADFFLPSPRSATPFHRSSILISPYHISRMIKRNGADFTHTRESSKRDACPVIVADFHFSRPEPPEPSPAHSLGLFDSLACVTSPFSSARSTLARSHIRCPEDPTAPLHAPANRVSTKRADLSENAGPASAALSRAQEEYV